MGSSQTRNVGLARERAGDRNPLPLAARELVRVLVAIGGGEADLRQQRVDARANGAPAAHEPLRADRLGDDVDDAPARIEARIRILEDHLQLAAQRLVAPAGRECGDVRAVVTDRARREAIEAHDQTRHRRFAAARFADEAERLAAPDVEAHVVDRVQQDAAAGARARGSATAATRRTSSCACVTCSRLRCRVTAAPSHRASTRRATRRHRADPAARAGTGRRRARSADGTGSPAGMAVSRGIVPSICTSRSRSPASDGIEPIRPIVYGCRGCADHVRHRPDLDDAPGVHHGDAIGRFGDHAHVVRDQHHRRAVIAAQALQQRDDLRLDRHVERGGRLVGDDQLRSARERERDHDALAHAARELVRIVVDAPRGGRNADFLQQARSRALRAALSLMRQVRADRLGRAGARSYTADRARSAGPGRSRRCAGRGCGASRRATACRCARRRARISPAATRPGGSSRPMIAAPVSDLPAPDSPTTPSTSPGAMANDTSSTAVSTPRRVGNSTRRWRTSSSGHGSPHGSAWQRARIRAQRRSCAASD